MLDEANYLLEKDYLRAAAVLVGAALEEGLKARARAVPIELTSKDSLFPVIDKLKKNGILTEFEAKKLEACGAIRNAAAHGGEFTYSRDDVASMSKEVESTLSRLLGHK